MRFDSCGNLYLYEPGAGMSGEPKRVIEYGSEEVIYATDDVETRLEAPVKSLCKFENVSSSKVHRMVPHNGAVITKITTTQSR